MPDSDEPGFPSNGLAPNEPLEPSAREETLELPFSEIGSSLKKPPFSVSAVPPKPISGDPEPPKPISGDEDVVKFVSSLTLPAVSISGGISFVEQAVDKKTQINVMMIALQLIALIIVLALKIVFPKLLIQIATSTS